MYTNISSVHIPFVDNFHSNHVCVLIELDVHTDNIPSFGGINNEFTDKQNINENHITLGNHSLS